MVQMFSSAIDHDRCDVDCLHPDAIRPVLGLTLSPGGSSAVADLFRLLADPSRVRILHLLAVTEVPLCVCDMALVLGMSVSALSHQLRSLRDRRAVRRDKIGRIAYYTLLDEHVRHLILDGVEHLAETDVAAARTSVDGRRRHLRPAAQRPA